MTEQSPIPPIVEDPVLDRQLLALKRFKPIVGFEDRVLSGVWRPAPMFVLIWQDRLSRVFTPARRWMLAGVASLGSFGSAMILGHLVTNHLLKSDLGLRVSSAMAAGATENISWDRVSGAVASLAPAAAGSISGLPAASFSQLASVAPWATLVTIISGIGLYLVARRPVRERVRSYASR